MGSSAQAVLFRGVVLDEVVQLFWSVAGWLS